MPVTVVICGPEGAFNALASELTDLGLVVKGFTDSSDLLGSLKALESLPLFILGSLLYDGAGGGLVSALEVAPKLRAGWPLATIWISTAFAEDEIDEQWRPPKFCDAYVPLPPSAEMVITKLNEVE